MLTKANEAKMKALQEAVRKRAWIGNDATMIKIKDMDDHHLLKAYRLSVSWYRQVQQNGEEALNTIFKLWDMASTSSHDYMSYDMGVSDCCFEQEADYVLSVMEVARRYTLALHREIKRRNLVAVLNRMIGPFASGKRGWNAKHKTAVA